MGSRDGVREGGPVVRLARSGEAVAGVLIGMPYLFAPGDRQALWLAINLFSPEEEVMRVLVGEPRWLVRALALRRELRLADQVLRFEHQGEAGLAVSPVRPLLPGEVHRAAACPPHDLARLLGGPPALPLPRPRRDRASRGA